MTSAEQMNEADTNVFPYVNIIRFPDFSSRPSPVKYSVEFLLSLKETAYCKQKPSDLPDIIDKDKINSESGPSRSIRKQRRQGSGEVDLDDLHAMHGSIHEHADNLHRGKGKGARRDNHGWQPVSQERHEEAFHQGALNRMGVPNKPGTMPNRAPMVPGATQQRIIPGKGVPRRDAGMDMPKTGAPAPAANWEHQPALANVYMKHQQGLTGATTQVAKGLDAFSMGDIRQAEKFIEGGRMGLDEYARKVASGEISRDVHSMGGQSSAGGFFADEGTVESRPWLQNTTSQGRIIPGSARVNAPPPPPSVQAPAAGPIGKDSNGAGLQLLQMLIDRKQLPVASPQQPKTGVGAPRQLTQQQINELIAMSKKAAAANPAGRPSGVPMKAPAPQVAPPRAPQQGTTPPHVAALLEQLHRQQMAQQQAAPAAPPPSAPQSGSPQECQQQ